MAQPTALGAYGDCESHFERALAAPNGIALTLETPGTATRLAQKMNTYRTLLRKQSKTIYDPTDPRWGTSIYDKFKVSVDKENPSRLIVRAYNIDVLHVEELPAEE